MSDHKLSQEVAAYALSHSSLNAPLPIGDRINDFGQFSDPELIRHALGEFVHDAPSRWSAWLSAFDLQATTGTEGVADQLDLAVTAVFERLCNDETLDAEVDRSEIVEQLGAFIEAGVPYPGSSLRELIERRLLDNPTNDALMEARTRLLSIADDFRQEDRLLSGAWFADACANAAGRALQGEEPSEGWQLMVLFANVTVERYGSMISATSLQSLVAALDACKWIPTSQAIVGDLNCVAAAEKNGKTLDVDLSATRLRQLVDQNPDDSDLAVGKWISIGTPSVEEIWDVVEPFTNRPLPANIEAALSEMSLGGNDRYKLVKPALEPYLAGSLDESFLRAARFADAGDGRVTQALIKLADGFTEAEQYRRLLALWALSRPHEDPNSSKFTDSVLVPLVKLGTQGVQVMIDEFYAITDLPVAKRPGIAAALFAQAEGVQPDQLRSAMESAGWNDGKKWWEKLIPGA